MGAKSILSCVLLVAAQGCATPYEVEERQDTAASAVSGQACASAGVQAKDDFEGRSRAASGGWAKGRVSDGVPAITTATLANAKTTAVLTSKVAATTDGDAKSTAYIEREVPAAGCIAADFDVLYTEEQPFPESAWTYFFWIDGADDLNVSLFRRANYVRLAAQRGGEELERIDVELPPNKWSRVHVELDVSTNRPVMSISINKGTLAHATLSEALAAPYFVSMGTWARGAVPAHQFEFDNFKLWY